MKINTYGLKMTGLKAASSATKGLRGYYSGNYVEIFYDRATGEVWGNYQANLGQNSWTQYNTPDVTKICNVSEPHTMQQIADLIRDYMYGEAR